MQCTCTVLVANVRIRNSTLSNQSLAIIRVKPECKAEGETKIILLSNEEGKKRRALGYKIEADKSCRYEDARAEETLQKMNAMQMVHSKKRLAEGADDAAAASTSTCTGTSRCL